MVFGMRRLIVLSLTNSGGGGEHLLPPPPAAHAVSAQRQLRYDHDAAAASASERGTARSQTCAYVGFHLHSFLLALSESMLIARGLANSCWPYVHYHCAPSRAHQLSRDDSV